MSAHSHTPDAHRFNPTSNTEKTAQRVLDDLKAEYSGAPFLTPRQIGPALGISDNGFTKYCRASRHTRLWRGSYRFYLDDPGHVRVLLEIIKVVLWAGTRVPARYRVRDRVRGRRAV